MSDTNERSVASAGSHAPYQFRVRLDTNDHGSTVFEQSGEYNCQWELSTAVAYAMARGMYACLCNPPSSGEMLSAMESQKESRGLLAAFGYAVAHCWSGRCNLEQAVSIRIDIDKLMEDESSDKKNLAAKVLRGMGVDVVRSG